MNPVTTLPNLLLVAWLLPLASFAVISVGYSVPQLLGLRPSYARSKLAGYIAIGAIVAACVLSLVAMFGVWLPTHELAGVEGHSTPAHAESTADEPAHAERHAVEPNNEPPPYYSGDWYALGTFGDLRLTIGYYIDTLTVTMFCVVTLIASCVHVYSVGYMHDELDDFTDPEVTLADGEKLVRRGRFHRFFQYLSLFSFSMLGICLAGNLAMVFVFWELVGICSYFLIGFYIERRSACNAANKAFIVNRIGDFGMLVGLMAIWATLGTFSFGDSERPDGTMEQGIFSLLHEEKNDYHLRPADGMVEFSGREEVAEVVRRERAAGANPQAVDDAIADKVDELRKASDYKYGHWLLFVAGVGIFCGCMGKSAQFPLHVWLPDAMEGPTPVSALVHSATMVAAGVFLVGRTYPIFTPEALLVVAAVGAITLFMAATIAITATDIKRVLAYSTVSQLGYMMLSLGIGGWVAGLFHLIAHAFFKGLLFLCSGSVIHAVHTNEMTEMGGLRRKMPITAYTMLTGCLAIAGAGIPLFIGLSGFHSKDAIVEQALSYARQNTVRSISWVFFVVAVAGAAITAFYMFRLWFMTFIGEPRDRHRYDHAHESPRSMTVPLVVLAVFVVVGGWPVPGTNFGIVQLLEQARPVGTQLTSAGELLPDLLVPKEHQGGHGALNEVMVTAGLSAFGAAVIGFLLASAIYWWKWINPETLRRALRPFYSLCWHKWWFDELYDFVFVRPTLAVGAFVARWLDLGLIDGIIHACAYVVRSGAAAVSFVGDRLFIDNFVDGLAARTWELALSLRSIQTGRLRQYVVLLAIGTIVLFLVASVWRYALAGG